MYTTDKEVHILIEQKLQQISSNRHQSIAPNFIDMILNKSMYSVIAKKFNARANVKREGFEDSILRYDELQNLKRTVRLFENYNESKDSTYVFDIPFDVLYSISGMIDLDIECESLVDGTDVSLIQYDLKPIESIVGIITSTASNKNGAAYTVVNAYANNAITNKFETQRGIDNVLKSINRDSNMPIVVSDKGSKSVITTTSDITFTSQIVQTTSSIIANKCHIGNNYSYSKLNTPVRFLSTIDRDKVRENYYYQKSFAKSPIAVIENGSIIIDKRINNTLYGIRNFRFEYIAAPTEFDICNNSIPNLPFISDVIDMAIGEILLILKDPTATPSIQLNNQNI